jgi:hypothetical protein
MENQYNNPETILYIEPVPVTNPIIKIPRTYNIADLISALICLAFGYIFVKFVLFNPISLYTMLFNFAFGGLAVFYIKSNSKKIKRSHIAIIAVAFLFNCIYIVSSNTFISFIGGTFAVMLGVYIFFISANNFRAFGNSFLTDFFRSLFVPFLSFGECGHVVAWGAKKKKSSKKIGYILLGLLIGIPLTIICGALLMSADDVFKNLISKIVQFGLDETLDFIIRFAFGIPVASYLFGMLFTNVKRENPPSLEKPFSTHIVPVPAVCSAVAPVCLLYVMFFISHFAYLTSALFGSLHTDFSYAEYARQGFFELCAVAMINLVVIIFLNIFDKKNDDGTTAKAVKFFTMFIIVSTIILIITALGKMFLYIDTYGLTRLRVYTSWFMVLLLICFLVIAVRTFKEKLKIFKPLFAVFSVMLGLLCFGDVDGFIARHNISAYQSGRLSELDVDLFYELSDTAVIYAISLADDEIVGEKIQAYLQQKYTELNELEFKQFNLESRRALRALREYLSPASIP